MKRVLGILVAVFVLPVLAGCSGTPPLVPVSGTVKLDGKPIAEATVTFLPTEGTLKWVARGKTDSQGLFQLRYLDQTTGVPVGEYKVTLSTERQDIEGAEIFPARYHNPEETILKVTVPEGGKSFDLEAQSTTKQPPTRPQPGA